MDAAATNKTGINRCWAPICAPLGLPRWHGTRLDTGAPLGPALALNRCSPGTAMPIRGGEKRVRTFRRRLATWAFLALGGVISALTAATVIEELRLVTALQRSNGESLVRHLAAMPEFQRDSRTAREHVAVLAPTLGHGASLELAPAAEIAGAAVVAGRRLDLVDGAFELRYSVDPRFVRQVARRAAAVHAIDGLIALAIGLAALEWILHAKLARPLKHIAHRIRFMRRGGGWEPVLPRADAEIAEVADALRELGPAMHRQVLGWVEAERRAGAAHALSDIRARLREPKVRALALLGDLQARDAVSPLAKHRVRAIVAEMERIAREIDAEERRLFPVPAQRGEGSE